ncbi:MAG TPA: hypothetical protein VGH83_01065 [Candidatus Acidoferrum sp.]
MPETKAEFALNFSLTREQFDMLLLVMGMAVGAAMKNNDVDLALRIFDFANLVNKDNPNWTPYVFFGREKGAAPPHDHLST